MDTKALHVAAAFLGLILNWLIQPWWFGWSIRQRRRHSSRTMTTTHSWFLSFLAMRWRVGVALWVFASVSTALSLYIHAQQLQIKPLVFILLAYPQAMQFLRYLHALVVGSRVFGQQFGLDNDKDYHKDIFRRIQIFMWCPPTVIFATKNIHKDDNDDVDRTNMRVVVNPNEWKHHVKMALLDIIICEVICAVVVLSEMHRWLPHPLQQWLRMYIMAFSTSILKLLLECPCTYFLSRRRTDIVRIIPIYHQPYLTTSPRDLWNQRWSVTAGYHLRCAFYNPAKRFLDKHTTTPGTASFSLLRCASKVLAAAVPFFINCVLHITWWSWLVKGQVDHAYWNLLLAYPLISFAIQDAISALVSPGKRCSETINTEDAVATNDNPYIMLQRMLNLALLWIGFLWIADPMSRAQGLNSSLEKVCRSNLGLPMID